MKRRPKIHYASRGNAQGQGASKSEAKANLEASIDWYLAQASGAWIETRFGMVLIVTATPNGFETKLLFPSDIVVHGMRHWSGTSYSNADLKSVVLSMRLHAAHCAWTPESDDAEIVALSGLENTGELERWLKFQRAYIVAKANGLSDGDAHREACNIKYATAA